MTPCLTCRYWLPSTPPPNEPTVGICRRHAPIAMPVLMPSTMPANLQLSTTWPSTRAGDSCGDHQGHPDGIT